MNNNQDELNLAANLSKKARPPHGDRGGNGCCGNNANAQARDRGKPATGLAIGMPGGKLLVQHRDLAADGHDLANQYLQRPPGIGWQGALVGERLLGELC